MNPFARHGIDHLSPSSLNLWAAEPALWVMERLLDRRSPTSATAVRGRAVEYGIHVGLMDPDKPVAECAGVACKLFDRSMVLEGDPRREDERKRIPAYVAHGLEELRQYGAPNAYQERVSVTLDDVPVPIVGFIDWRFDAHGLIVDLKTAERLRPRSWTDSGRHARGTGLHPVARPSG